LEWKIGATKNRRNENGEGRVDCCLVFGIFVEEVQLEGETSLPLMTRMESIVLCGVDVIKFAVHLHQLAT
jgi:hypothetical protein